MYIHNDNIKKVNKSFNIVILNITSNQKVSLNNYWFSTCFEVLVCFFFLPFIGRGGGGQGWTELRFENPILFTNWFYLKKNSKIKSKGKSNRSYTLRHLPPLAFKKFLFLRHEVIIKYAESKHLRIVWPWHLKFTY